MEPTTSQPLMPPPPPDDLARPPGNPNWVKGMKSPNPAGRPVGSTAQTVLIKKMLENADGILDALIEKALEGDSGAAALILSRILPTIKAQAEKVQFPFDAAAPVSEQVEMILRAISEGHVAPDVGKHIIDAVASLASVRASEDLEARLLLLEAKRL
jgi:hypothetical protein